ncbi:MAG TPA: glycosyltransferase [bacterium]|nr:glycosyltransferase [bacterium]
MSEKLPKISICLPTYNNATTLPECLERIASQNYPKNLIEILVIDGGSSDETLNICREYTDLIFENPFRVEEKGRVIGIEHAKGDVVGFVDADNFLEGKDFFRKISKPFMENPEVVFVQPRFYTTSKGDDLITRYIAAIGGDDPLSYYLGVYDHHSYINGKWSGSTVMAIAKERQYTLYSLKNIQDMPPFGANGCFISRSCLDKVKHDPFLHTDVVFRLLKQKNLFAIAEAGLKHKQNGSVRGFLMKKLRRASRNYDELEREFFFHLRKRNLLLFFLCCIFIIPLVIDSIRGFIRRPGSVWFWHPIITELTFLTYIYGVAKRRWQSISKSSS